VPERAHAADATRITGNAPGIAQGCSADSVLTAAVPPMRSLARERVTEPLSWGRSARTGTAPKDDCGTWPFHLLRRSQSQIQNGPFPGPPQLGLTPEMIRFAGCSDGERAH
jgi:hypothetical protein